MWMCDGKRNETGGLIFIQEKRIKKYGAYTIVSVWAFLFLCMWDLKLGGIWGTVQFSMSVAALTLSFCVAGVFFYLSFRSQQKKINLFYVLQFTQLIPLSLILILLLRQPMESYPNWDVNDIYIIMCYAFLLIHILLLAMNFTAFAVLFFAKGRRSIEKLLSFICTVSAWGVLAFHSQIIQGILSGNIQ